MFDFKSFMLKEDVGLGDIGKTINNVFNTQKYRNHAGSFIDTDYSHPSPAGYIGDPTFMPKLPATTLNIPYVEREGRISVLLAKKNPIFVKLTDGTEAYFSYDEFKRIEGNPALGKTMRIIFQRHPQDASLNNSKIDRAIVID